MTHYCAFSVRLISPYAPQPTHIQEERSRMDLWRFIQKKIELLSINRGILYGSYFTKMKTNKDKWRVLREMSLRIFERSRM